MSIGLPLGVVFGAVGLNLALGAPPSSLAELEPWYALVLVFAVRLVDPLDGPMGEEPGWRGFALPRLQAEWSPLIATLILALLVVGWHLPPARPPRAGTASRAPLGHGGDHVPVHVALQSHARQRAHHPCGARCRGHDHTWCGWLRGGGLVTVRAALRGRLVRRRARSGGVRPAALARPRTGTRSLAWRGRAADWLVAVDTTTWSDPDDRDLQFSGCTSTRRRTTNFGRPLPICPPDPRRLTWIP